jgi:proline dehydrogenase
MDEALAAAEMLNRKHISVSLDHLGENVSSEGEAEVTAHDYIDILNHIQASGVEANISIKLTALGLDIGEELCRKNVTCVLRHARDLHIFVRVDMEGSDYTDRTLNLVLDLRREFDQIGTVMQSMLYRTPHDVTRLIETSTRVRLVKGAYLEPASLAYPKKADVDAAYIELMHTLLEHGTYPAIATHDEHITLSPMPVVSLRNGISHVLALSFRCFTVSAATSRSSWPAMATTCASMCPMAPSGILTLPAAWPSAPPT